MEEIHECTMCGHEGTEKDFETFIEYSNEGDEAICDNCYDEMNDERNN